MVTKECEGGSLATAPDQTPSKDDDGTSCEGGRENFGSMPLLEAALAYAAHGWHVFPCIPGGKEPLTPNGFKDASTDQEQIRAWWALHPDANIGFWPGENIGVLDPDVDQRTGKNGLDALEALEAEHGALPDTVTSITGGGGRHLFFKADGGAWGRSISKDIDSRGAGGYVVLPPSIHPNGTKYQWAPGKAPGEVPIADPSAWLITGLGQRREASKADDWRLPEVEVWGREKLMRAAELISHDDKEAYPQWVRIGLAFFRASNGGADGFEAFDAWSQRWHGYDPDVTERTWHDIANNPPRDIGPATLVHEARRVEPSFGRPTLADRFADVAAQINLESLHGVDRSVGAEPLRRLNHHQKRAFIKQHKAPSYVVHGIIQRRTVYSCTANTGHGKTAILLCIADHVSRGAELAGRQVKQGKVFYLAAENPDDVRGRVMLMEARATAKDPDAPLFFIDGTFDLEADFAALRAEVEAEGGADLVVVDTGVAFLAVTGAGDENDNLAMHRFAKILRSLVDLPGGPCVIALMHPRKNAGKDELLPRGGGSFYSEMDGNLSIWAESDRTEATLHWAGKFRGAPFDPVHFKLEVGTCPELSDVDGNLIPSVFAYPLRDDGATWGRADTDNEDLLVLATLNRHPGVSLVKLALVLEWADDENQAKGRSKVRRVLHRLEKARLVEKLIGKYHPTTKGKRALEHVLGSAEPGPIGPSAGVEQ